MSKNLRSTLTSLTLFALMAGFFVRSSLAFAQRNDFSKATLERQREEWFYNQRAYPYGQIPAGAYKRGYEQRDRLLLKSQRRIGSSAATLQPSTPLDFSGPWSAIGPQPLTSLAGNKVSGRVTSLVVDPTSSNTAYLGAAGGGVWKTSDGGVNWTPLTDFSFVGAVGALALDPNNPQTVYAGTGEGNFSLDSYNGVGIFKSTDGGNTWAFISFVFGGLAVSSIAVDPANSNVVLVAISPAGFCFQEPCPSVGSSPGIWRTTDGGFSWQQVLAATAATDVLFDSPSGQDIAYAALGDSNGQDAKNGIAGVYRSNNGGQSWNLILGGTSPPSSIGRIALSKAPSNSSILYASIQDAGLVNPSSYGQLLAFLRTSDGGNTWLSFQIPNYCGTQCWYDNVIAVDPADANQVFAGGQDHNFGGSNLMYFDFVTDNFGNVSVFPADRSVGADGSSPHSDTHALAISSDRNKFYVGNDGGAWLLSNAETTGTDFSWSSLNSTLNTIEMSPALSIDPSNSSHTVAGAQDNGILQYSGAQGWTQVGICGDGGWTAMDLTQPTTVYASCPGMDNFGSNIIQKSTLGSQFVSANNGVNGNDRHLFVSPLVIDSSNSNTLYYGSFLVYQTKDGANSWFPISPDLSLGSGMISTIAVAPNDPNTVYAGTSDGRVQVTHNANSQPTWTDVSSGLPNLYVTQIAVDQANASIAYVTFSGFTPSLGSHVFRTADAGLTWTDISQNLPDTPFNDFVVDPDLPNVFYAAADSGVFVTNDGGSTWAVAGTNNTTGTPSLPDAVVLSLKIHRASRVLRAATHGRGGWDLPLPPAVVSGNPDFGLFTEQTTEQINAGQSASFNMSVGGANAFSGNISVSCTGAPVGPVCTASPGSVTLAGSQRSNFVISFVTSSGTGAMMKSSPDRNLRGYAPILWFAVVTVVLGTLKVQRPYAKIHSAVVISACLLFSAGCGGNGSAGNGGGGGQHAPPTQPGTYNVTVTGTSGTLNHSTSVVVIVR